MEVTKPEQLWVSDITYIQTTGGHNYLSLVTDAYSKKIMGYELLDNLTTAGPLKALESALKSRKYNHDLVHHSDRGLQYCANEYQQILYKNGIQPSMTQNSDPYENAVAERINGILKQEFYIDKYNKDLPIMKQIIKETVDIYNEKRPNYLSIC